MDFQFTVNVTVGRESGKFASRDEIEERLKEQLDLAVGDLDLTGVGADGTSDYVVLDSEVLS